MQQISTKPDWVRLALLVFVSIILVFGGASRGDVYSLLVVRPIAAIALVLALAGLTRADYAAARFPLLAMAAYAAVVAIQLVPLPPEIWNALPGRARFASGLAAANAEAVWRPATMAPSLTWNGLFALMVPLATLLLVAGHGLEMHRRIAWLLMAAIGLSAVIGLVQLLGEPGGGAYFYDITNDRSAVGLFANRNHHALFLAIGIPLLVLLRLQHGRKVPSPGARIFVTWAGVTALTGVILLTGSRAGLVLGVIAIGGALWIQSTGASGYRSQPAVDAMPRRRIPIWAGGVGLAVLAVVFFASGTAQRVVQTDRAEELRLAILDENIQMVRDFFPLGAGVGSYPLVFAAYEPQDVLDVTYVNHAHNDALEILFELGIFGAIFILATVLSVVWMAKKSIFSQDRLEKTWAITATSILLMIGVASVFDYPLRTPSIAMISCITGLWLYMSFTGKIGDAMALQPFRNGRTGSAGSLMEFAK